jgi:hypothetical protein
MNLAVSLRPQTPCRWSAGVCRSADRPWRASRKYAPHRRYWRPVRQGCAACRIPQSRSPCTSSRPCRAVYFKANKWRITYAIIERISNSAPDEFRKCASQKSHSSGHNANPRIRQATSGFVENKRTAVHSPESRCSPPRRWTGLAALSRPVQCALVEFGFACLILPTIVH